MPDATTASDWLPTFEFGLANDSSCLKRPVRVSGAEGRFTLKLGARQSSSRWQPPALNVDRPTAAFEASELSLSTRCCLSHSREAHIRALPFCPRAAVRSRVPALSLSQVRSSSPRTLELRAVAMMTAELFYSVDQQIKQLERHRIERSDVRVERSRKA
jgi:hypothetical protein